MQKKNLASFLLVFIALSFILFIVITQILAIPLWWIFGFIHPLSSIGLPTLVVKVSPENPLIPNENITVTVTNSSSQLPVEDAEVTVQKDGTEITLYTDSNGQAFFPYFGEVTVITAQKSGFASSNIVAIPTEPIGWVLGVLSSLGTGIVSGLVVAFASEKLRKRKARITKKKASRKFIEDSENLVAKAKI